MSEPAASFEPMTAREQLEHGLTRACLALASELQQAERMGLTVRLEHERLVGPDGCVLHRLDFELREPSQPVRTS